MSMNNTNTTALTVTDTDRWTRDDLNALKETIGKDLSVAEFRVFIAAAKRLELDPFARQIYGIKQQGRMVIQVSIDGFRLIAERTGKYAGQLGPFWCGADGVWQEVWLSNTPPLAAKVGVLRRDFAEPMWGVARTAAYTKSNSPTWNNLPDVMIAKVAESLALRRAFPAELSGVYTHEEMAQAQQGEDTELPTPPQPRQTAHEPHTTVDASVVTEDAPAASSPRHTQPAPAKPRDPMDTTIASAEEQQRLAEKLRATGYDTLTTAQGFLNDTASHIDALALKQGTSDLTLRELAAITQRLTRVQANGKAAAR